jgi:hypothetical protein
VVTISWSEHTAPLHPVLMHGAEVSAPGSVGSGVGVATGDCEGADFAPHAAASSNEASRQTRMRAACQTAHTRGTGARGFLDAGARDPATGAVGRAAIVGRIVSTVRTLRGLVPFEIACVLAVVVIPLSEALPVALPLLVMASLSRWLRGRSWGELFAGGAERAVLGAAAGVVAAVVAAPLYGAFEAPAVEWWLAPVLRGGDVVQLAVVLALLAVTAIAMELALRGWLVERALELVAGAPALAIGLGAVAEALVTPGPVTARIGAGLFGAGLGALHVAGGRSVLAPVAARCAFVAGAVLVELVGG